MNKIKVLGIGPGSKDYILPKVIKECERCDVLIGGRRHLEEFKHLNKDTRIITKELKVLVDEMKILKESKTLGVIVSGDPGYYSFLDYLKRNFERDELEVIPGISSLQYLFAKGVLSWKDAYMGSVHGRSEDNLIETIKSHGKVALLTDKKNTPKMIAKIMKESDITNRKILIGENLSYSDERITELSIERCMDFEANSLCVMVIHDE